MWIEIVLFLLLGVCAVSDGIKKEIPLVPVWAPSPTRATPCWGMASTAAGT